MNLNLIFAVDKNNVFSINNKIPWYCKEDFKYFKDMTTKTIDKNKKNIVVMGRNIFEDIGKPLKDRINIIITSDKNYKEKHNDVYVIHNIENISTYINSNFKDIESVFIIGGMKIIEYFLERNKCINKIYISRIHVDCDINEKDIVSYIDYKKYDIKEKLVLREFYI